MSDFLEEVLELVFDFLTTHQDRNAVSLVCKSWFRVSRVKALTLKGKPHFADFNLVPHDWGGFVYPWIEAMAKSYPGLEELRLKRMVVSDDSLELLSRSFPNFKSLVLVTCEGFTTDGLAAIAANCRVLRELDLQENEVDDQRGHWLSCFPQTCTSLVSLNFACLKGEVNLGALERLVARCPNLRSLKLNRSVPLEMLQRILNLAPHLVDLGTGSYIDEPESETYEKFSKAVIKCKSVRSLSGFLEVAPACLPAMYSICSNLTSLNLSYAPGIKGTELIGIILRCNKLQRLWILDCIGDKGLEVVAFICKELQELRVFPSLHGAECMCNGTWAELPQFRSLPDYASLTPKKPDHVTLQPLDEGFGAIVESCKGLRRLSLSGLFDRQGFHMLSVAFAGDSDKGMLYVLNGCRKLRKLEIRDSPFGDMALLRNMGKYEAMRSLWMSSCDVTLRGCKTLANTMTKLNVEIMNESQEKLSDSQKVDKMYVYRSLDGPRRMLPTLFGPCE
ncbi:hypothetical protein MKW92_023168 [Papaver armeniacum]|nr:hypothetical protein MKW92_023168 [Papaver armeniacum]